MHVNFKLHNLTVMGYNIEKKNNFVPILFQTEDNDYLRMFKIAFIEDDDHFICNMQYNFLLPTHDLPPSKAPH